MPPFTILAAGEPTTQAVVLTAIISASTAAVIALGIEWFAKPTLDARKERILNRHEALREVLAAAREEAWRIETTVIDFEDAVRPELRKDFLTNRSRVSQPSNSRNRQALQQITVIMTKRLPTIEHGNQGHETRAMNEAQVLWCAVAVMETPLWRWRRRRRVVVDFLIEAGLAPH